MTTDEAPLTYQDYTDAAEAAQRGEAWAQAAVLWRRALETMPVGRGRKAAVERDRYLDRAADCDRKAAMDDALAKIAKDVLQIPTLKSRHSDSLDFHEMAVWRIQQVLRAAYDAGRAAGK